MALKPSAVSACPAAASVLVADDDAETCRLVANALGLRHDQIRQATDGRVALALALGSTFSCVITETTLPFIDGYALCELLRTDSATRSTPILVVTAEERTELLARALQAGANAVLTKPVPPETLRAEIDRLMPATHDRHEHAPARM
jgi:CheY-like chemotaxis protein